MKTLFALFISLPLAAASIVSMSPASVGGAHGMEVIGRAKVLVSDTFKSQGTAESFLYIQHQNSLEQLSFSGDGLAGISTVPNGYVVCDLAGSRVVELDGSFQVRRAWPVVHPWNAKLAPDGQLYALTFEGSFERLLPNLTTETILTGLDAPFDFAFTADPRQVWISEQGAAAGRVARWSVPAQGPGALELTAHHGWQNPEGLDLSGTDLWVVDTEAGSLVKVDASGNATLALSGLGIPILVRNLSPQKLLVYSNRYQGHPSFLTVLK